MYTHTCGTYEFNAISHVTMVTVHIFDKYHWKNIVATLHIYITLHCYCSALRDLTLVYICFIYPVFNTNCYKVMGINVNKINMATKCKQLQGLINLHTHITCMHICTKF